MNKKRLIISFFTTLILLISYTSISGTSIKNTNIVKNSTKNISNTDNALPDIEATNIKPGFQIGPIEWYFGIMCIVKNVGNAPMKINDKIRIEAIGELKDDEGNFIQYDTFHGEDHPELEPGKSCGIFFTWDEKDLYSHPIGTIKFKCDVITDFDEERSDNNYYEKTFKHKKYQDWDPLRYNNLCSWLDDLLIDLWKSPGNPLVVYCAICVIVTLYGIFCGD